MQALTIAAATAIFAATALLGQSHPHSLTDGAAGVSLASYSYETGELKGRQLGYYFTYRTGCRNEQYNATVKANSYGCYKLNKEWEN